MCTFASRGTGFCSGIMVLPLIRVVLVLVVVLGVVFGFLYWVFVQAWNGLAIAMGPAGDLAQHLVFGSWLLVAPVAIAILRRPGVGILAEMLAAVIEVVFLGSPVGPPGDSVSQPQHIIPKNKTLQTQGNE